MKKIYLVGIILCMLLASGCAKTTDNITENINNDKNDSINETNSNEDIVNNVEEQVNNDNEDYDMTGNGFAFSTEYDIEDYCQGCFIVSKNDGLLYGVLDKTGKEILPVEYDDIQFMNKKSVLNNCNEKIYIKTNYENQRVIYNGNGKQILDKNVSYINYELENTYGSDSSLARFIEKSEDNRYISFYSEDGELLFEQDLGDESSTIEITNITSGLYLVSRTAVETKSGHAEIIFQDETLYDNIGNIIKQWDGATRNDLSFIEDDKYTFSLSSKEGFSLYAVDKNGDLYDEGEITKEELIQLRYKDYLNNDNNVYYLGSNRIYLSNNTWKLVNEKDEPLYDDRYYQCFKKENCYFLMNEDNEMCLVDRFGNLLVEYGWLSFDGEMGRFNGLPITDDTFFAGDDGACFTQGNDVYLFMSNQQYMPSK